METDLNKKVEYFFANIKLEEITIETIKKYFKNLHEVNNYGGLIHAAINYQYPEAKILRFSETLLRNGVDVNLKGEYTGFSFIHLALYGYTDKNGVDHSYSTEFIVKLINLGKKYGLDVGIVDNDLDSLIHTAVASEVYTGSVISLIEALGPNFDVSCKDKSGNNIYQALLKYKEEAKEIKNKGWYSRLTKEEEEIKKLTAFGGYNLDEINKELVELKNKFIELSDKTDINYILENYQYINELHSKLEFCLTTKEKLTKEKDLDSYKIWVNYNALLRKNISNYIEKLADKPNFMKIDRLSKIISSFGFADMNSALEAVKKDYQTKINIFEENIRDAQTLLQVKGFKEQLNDFSEEEIKEELNGQLIERIDEFEELIEDINNQFGVLNFIYTWLDKENSNPKRKDESSKDYLSNITIEELEKVNLDLENTIEENKDIVEQIIVEKTEELLNSIRELGSSNIFEVGQLLKIVEDKVSPKNNKPKVMKKNGK